MGCINRSKLINRIHKGLLSLAHNVLETTEGCKDVLQATSGHIEALNILVFSHTKHDFKYLRHRNLFGDLKRHLPVNGRPLTVSLEHH